LFSDLALKPLIEEVLYEIWVILTQRKKKIKRPKFSLTQKKKLSRTKKEEKEKKEKSLKELIKNSTRKIKAPHFRGAFFYFPSLWGG
jgi:hypothetical protein